MAVKQNLTISVGEVAKSLYMLVMLFSWHGMCSYQDAHIQKTA
jgi:hypothetical protein